jgi:hypothetical protein
LHSPSVLYSGTCISLSFHYHFTVSSVCTHYYGHGNVTSYFREQSFDFYGGGGHGIEKNNLSKIIKHVNNRRKPAEALI